MGPNSVRLHLIIIANFLENKFPQFHIGNWIVLLHLQTFGGEESFQMDAKKKASITYFCLV
jgi:hypothetical protein